MFANIPGLMDEIRDRFALVDNCPVQGPRIFFENAGGSLTLKSVVECTTEFAAFPDNQGRDNPASHYAVQTIDTAKKDARVFFNAPDGQVFVGESGTELLFRLVRSACLGSDEGGRVIGSSLEHPATRSACQRWAEITKKSYLVAEHNSDTGTVTIDDYLPVISADTRVATILHTSPVTGISVDVAGISRAIRNVSPECVIIVDGIQHAAHGGVDIDSYDIDGYVISPYKVFSRHGYGIAWISDRLARMPHDMLVGAPGDPWELGTRDTGSYATFSEVVRYLEWLGSRVSDVSGQRERIEAAAQAMSEHEKLLTDLMLSGKDSVKGLSDMPEIGLIGGTHNAHREGLVSLYVRDVDSVNIVSQLSTRGIRVHVRKADHYSANILTPLGLESCVRVSLCHYNTEQEIIEFLKAMNSIVSDTKP